MVEYAVLLGMIAMVCLVIIASLGSSVQNTFSQFSCGGLHGDAFRDCSGTSPGNSGH